MSRLGLIVGLILMVGCQGVIDDPTGDRPEFMPPTTDRPTPEVCETMPPALRGVPTRLLTSREVNNALATLFPTEALDAVSFRYDGRVEAFVFNSRDDVVEDHIHEFRAFAETVANRLVTNLAAIMECEGATESACAERYIPELATRAFRRPVGTEEADGLMGLYSAGSARGHDEGMRYVFEGILQAPSFIYVHETPTDILSPYEVAQRLSAMFARTVPDTELLAAAEDGSIMAADARVRQAERLLETNEGKMALRAFATEWFGVDALGSSQLGVDQPSLASGLLRESELFVDDIMESTASYADLLSAPHTFLNEELAAHYGVSLDGATEVGDGFYRVPSTRSAGLMTQGSFLSQHHGTIHRGLTIRSLIMCGNVPGPEGIDTASIEYGDTESDRSKADKRLAHDTCGGCHVMMEPIGLVFDVYDDLGVLRTEDAFGNPVTSDGEVLGDDFSTVVRDAPELGDVLAGAASVRACVAKQMFAWSYGRSARNADQCMVDRISTALEEGDDNVRAALVAIVATDEFVRSAGGEE